MAHLRTQIRKAFAAAIEAGVPSLAGKVFTSQVYPTDALPCASVFTPDENATENSVVQHRELVVRVEFRTKANYDLNDVLDDLTVLAEPAIVGDSAISALTKGLFLESSNTELDDESEKPEGVLTQSWAVLCRVDTRAPEAPAS